MGYKKEKFLTPKKIHDFCDILSKGYSVSAAALKGLGTSREYAYQLREKDEEFATAWDHAFETGTDYIEDNVLERALLKSDTLAIVTLKARRPHKYIEKSAIEIKHTVNITMQKAMEELRAIPREQLLAAQAMLNAPVIDNDNSE